MRALAGFARGRLLYRGKKPVHWCPTHQTALAEAEVEYADHTSPSIYVRFPLEPGQPAVEELVGKTPRRWSSGPPPRGPWPPTWRWSPTPSSTTSASRCARAEAAERVPPDRRQGPGRGVPGRHAAIDRAAAGRVDRRSPATALASSKGVRYRHPFVAAPRAERDFRLWFADYVTLEAGTGLVHTAPGHGADDYMVGATEGLAVYAPVDARGRYTDRGPGLGRAERVRGQPRRS